MDSSHIDDREGLKQLMQELMDEYPNDEYLLQTLVSGARHIFGNNLDEEAMVRELKLLLYEIKSSGIPGGDGSRLIH